jgi:hypothetical protein
MKKSRKRQRDDTTDEEDWSEEEIIPRHSAPSIRAIAPENERYNTNAVNWSEKLLSNKNFGSK